VLEAQRLALENQVQYLDRKADDAQHACQQLTEKLETMSTLFNQERDARAAPAAGDLQQATVEPERSLRSHRYVHENRLQPAVCEHVSDPDVGRSPARRYPRRSRISATPALAGRPSRHGLTPLLAMQHLGV
jgi:hypothetical protein